MSDSLENEVRQDEQSRRAEDKMGHRAVRRRQWTDGERDNYRRSLEEGEIARRFLESRDALPDVPGEDGHEY